MRGKMAGQTRPYRSLIVLDDCFESQEHGDHAGGAATDDVAAILETQCEDGGVDIFGGSYNRMLAGLTIQMAKEQSDLLGSLFRLFLGARCRWRGRVGCRGSPPYGEWPL